MPAQPVIACAQGPACGGGFSLLLASDVRYSPGPADERRLRSRPVDMGASYFLPRLVGSSVASEYLLTGSS